MLFVLRLLDIENKFTWQTEPFYEINCKVKCNLSIHQLIILTMTKTSKAMAAFVIGAAVGAMVGYFLKTEQKVEKNIHVDKKVH